MNDDPSENSAFHIDGTVFDTVWREGTSQLRPDDRRGGGAQIVTDKFSNVGKGALGLFQAGDVELPGGASHRAS